MGADYNKSIERRRVRMESIQIKDFLQYKYLSNVKYAPDGKKAAFVVANCNEFLEVEKSKSDAVLLNNNTRKPAIRRGSSSCYSFSCFLLKQV